MLTYPAFTVPHATHGQHEASMTDHTPADHHLPEPVREALMTRRRVLAGLAAAAILPAVGCGSSRSSRRRASATPSPRWPDHTDRYPSQRSVTPSAPTAGSAPGFAGVQRRSAWATAKPIPRRMDRMRPVRRITIHHDGMPPVALNSRSDVSARIDQIRKSHQQRGWGDIGYHFVVDPRGEVWEARPLSWQGAHVANQNPGNLGVLVLGNFQVQQPSSTQLDTLDRFVAAQMNHYGVTLSSVHTHQELAPTQCPGRSLQQHMTSTRRPSGRLAMLQTSASLG